MKLSRRLLLYPLFSLFIIGVFAASYPAHASAPSITQSAANGGSAASPTCTLGGTVSANDVLFVTSAAPIAVSTVTDSLGNSFSLQESQNLNAGSLFAYAQIYTAYVVNGGASDTITVAYGSTEKFGISCGEVANVISQTATIAVGGTGGPISSGNTFTTSFSSQTFDTQYFIISAANAPLCNQGTVTPVPTGLTLLGTSGADSTVSCGSGNDFWTINAVAYSLAWQGGGTTGSWTFTANNNIVLNSASWAYATIELPPVSVTTTTTTTTTSTVTSTISSTTTTTTTTTTTRTQTLTTISTITSTVTQTVLSSTTVLSTVALNQVSVTNALWFAPMIFFMIGMGLFLSIGVMADVKDITLLFLVLIGLMIGGLLGNMADVTPYGITEFLGVLTLMTLWRIR